MVTEKCTNCIHEWVCSLPASSDTAEPCPGFLDKYKRKEIIYARWLVPDEHSTDTCSNCLFEFVWDGDPEYHPAYCPNCGALMWLGDLDVKQI
jgi:hypothetical protein